MKLRHSIVFALALWLTLAASCRAAVDTELGWRAGGLNATNDQTYITVGNTAALSAERALTGSSTITITDNGANGSIVLSINGPLIQSAGGTGFGSYTAGDLLVVNDAGALVKLPLGANGEVLSVNTSLNPKFDWVAAGIGSVTSFSAGDLGPLFTTSEATVNTTPALTFSLSNAAANTAFGNFTGGAAAPGFGTVSLAAGGTGETTKTPAFDALAPTTTQGDLIYYNGTDNVRLAKGTANQIVGMNSGATAPEYKSVVAGTGITVNHTANQIEIVNSTLGTVTNFSAGDLSPLFTTSEATATSTPALSFSLSNAGAYTVFGNNTSGSAAPAYQTMVPEQTPQNQLLPFGAATSWRAAPTSGTLTGDYVHYGDWNLSNTVTCNRCRIFVKGNVVIDNAITVNTELSGGLSSANAKQPGGRGLGLGGGNGGTVIHDASGAIVQSGGGGGNGGAGGRGGSHITYSAGGQGGPAYNIENQLAGSGGGSGCGWTTTGGAGGAGGGGLLIVATGNITVSSNITAAGGAGSAGSGALDGGGGGGSGGTVAMICGGTWTNTATISVVGGAGGNSGASNAAGGGGGGGGRVWIRSGSTADNSGGTVTVTGGAVGTSAGTGTAAVAGSSGSSDIVGGATYPMRSAP
jgi:hypothetical protein